jgi:hypothetical protein
MRDGLTTNVAGPPAAMLAKSVNAGGRGSVPGVAVSAGRMKIGSATFFGCG